MQSNTPCSLCPLDRNVLAPVSRPPTGLQWDCHLSWLMHELAAHLLSLWCFKQGSNPNSKSLGAPLTH